VFKITEGENQVVHLVGRFDAAQTDKAKAFFDQISESVTLNLEKLDYISSAGLGVLLMVQKRIDKKGGRLKLIKVNKRVKEVLLIANFDLIAYIED
jgi:anti-anti-sigma factor